MLIILRVVLLLPIIILLWVYRSFVPPPPKICGTPGGPPIIGPRITLKDGRQLSYKEYGVPKENATIKIVYIHGHSTNKNDPYLATSDLVEELEIYIVSFDRPGYGESDPDPNRCIKSRVHDIEQLVDQLELGPKFYVVGYSMGAMLVWGCLKYIPSRLLGATLVSPAINYWWPGIPATLSREVFDEFLTQWRKWNWRFAYHLPWLVYWWNTQKFFLPQPLNYTYEDLDVFSKLDLNGLKEYSIQQGLYESYLCDIKVCFGKWEFDPLNLEDPFVGGKGSVHVWQGDKDAEVPVLLQRYIARRLSWVHYHEIPNGGHLFSYTDSKKDEILKTIIKGEIFTEPTSLSDVFSISK